MGSSYPADTQVVGINSSGETAGTYAIDYKNSYYGGFVRGADGEITEFSPPGARTTSVTGINSKGAVTGYFWDGAKYFGFVRSRGGKIRTVDLGADTRAMSINSKNMIAGTFVRSRRHNNNPFGFVLRSNGDLREPVHLPNPSIRSVNDGGATTGFFGFDGSGTAHGFLSD